MDAETYHRVAKQQVREAQDKIIVELAGGLIMGTTVEQNGVFYIEKRARFHQLEAVATVLDDIYKKMTGVDQPISVPQETLKEGEEIYG